MYRLIFDRRAKKEFDRLGLTVRRQLQKKLKERVELPRVEADRPRGMTDCYKIKARAAGVRLVYQVRDTVLVVFIVAIGERDESKSDGYDTALARLANYGDD